MDNNVVVEKNANQNNSTKVNRTSSDTIVTRNGINTAVDANVVHYIHRTTDMLSSKRGGILVDVSSLARPL